MTYTRQRDAGHWSQKSGIDATLCVGAGMKRVQSLEEQRPSLATPPSGMRMREDNGMMLVLVIILYLLADCRTGDTI